MKPAMLALVLLVLPVGASAQSKAPSRGVPLIAIDLEAGMSSIPDRLGEIYWESGTPMTVNLGVAVRVAPRGTIRPVVILEYLNQGIGVGDDLSCQFAPNNTCYQKFPNHSGWSLGVGARAVPGSGMVSFGAAFGTDWLERHAWHAEADVALRLGRRVGLLATIRHVEVHRSGPGRVWFRPITLGLRLQ